MSWRASAGYEGGLLKGLLGSSTFPLPPSFIFFFPLSFFKEKECLFTCARRRPRAAWWGAHLFFCPGRMFFCKNCEVLVGIGVFVGEIND